MNVEAISRVIAVCYHDNQPLQSPARSPARLHQLSCARSEDGGGLWQPSEWAAAVCHASFSQGRAAAVNSSADSCHPEGAMGFQANRNSLASPAFSQNGPFNDRPMCRICHEGSSQEDLLSPCECTGTLGTIHRSCLEHWLSSSNTSYCELCHFRFAVERKPRPLVEWLRNPGPQHEKRTLFGDMVCFLFITPLATISGWLCLRGAVDHLHFSSRLEAVGLIALTVALFTIYLFWTLVSFRYHCRLYNEWRRTNQRVILLIPKSVNVPSNQQSLLGLHSVKRNSKETVV
ncbi:E3 ubiquitin-protein ligase MARCHF3 isoform X1 [Macaca fascicularis]|uniref:E3 ubiquitin-protein ligase MARCHF3 isoform X1 n=2 Tax=Cercopithecinae TaxID=9528 RepID=UPI0032B05B39